MIFKGGYDNSCMVEIDTVFKNFTKCERCIHNQVCSFKTEQKKLTDKIETYLNNDSPSKIFNIILECKAYQLNEDESLKRQY